MEAGREQVQIIPPPVTRTQDIVLFADMPIRHTMTITMIVPRVPILSVMYGARIQLTHPVRGILSLPDAPWATAP